jgi:hypothetical protein
VRRALAGALALLVLGGCTTVRRQSLQDELKQLEADQRAGGDATALAPRFDGVATRALADARAERADPATAVFLYALAAEAAWQGGPAGGQILTESSNEGAAACAKLPAKSASAPRDCTIVRAAYPLGVYEDLLRQLRPLVAQRDALRAETPRKRLPASDRAVVERLYDGFETQTEKLGRIRDDLAAEGVRKELTDWVDRARRPVYCGAAQAASLSLDVDGTSLGGSGDLSARKSALRRDVERTQGAIDCRTAPQSVALP